MKKITRLLHRHYWRLTKLGSLGKEFECKCGKTKIDWDVQLPYSAKNLLGRFVNENKDSDCRAR